MKSYLFTHGKWIVLFLLLSLPLVMPLAKHGYFPTHDGEWAVVRLADMYREVKDLQFPPRFSGNLNAGYGYPLFEFAYPLPYYLGLPLFVAQVGLVNSIKILFALSVPLSGIGMFLAARRFWKSDSAGLISGILYMYFPYRVVDLYVRGSLGESLASVFFPFILYLMKSLSDKKSYCKIGLLGLTFGGLILTHNLMAVLFSVIIGTYVLYLLFTRSKHIVAILGGVVLGAVISLYFWLPALIEKQHIVLSQIPIADRDLSFVSITQLLTSPFGYGIPPSSDQFTYQIGISFILIVVLLVARVLYGIKTKKRLSQEVLLFSVLSLFYLLLMFPFSKLFWENMPLFKEINYAWTSLLPLSFLLSLIGGYISLQGRKFQIGTILAVVIGMIMVTFTARPQSYSDKGDEFYFTNDATTTSSKEYMPLWVKEIPTLRPTQKAEIVEGEGTVTTISSSSNKTEFTADMQTQGVVRLNTIYFPGWKWYDQGKEIPITYNNTQGVMESRLSTGKHLIMAKFTETPLRLISDLISIVGVGISIVLIVFTFFPKRLASKKVRSKTA